nr:Brp/Blh family beta-carotene 15,15'-dioxygenase [Parvularcula maris]
MAAAFLLIGVIGLPHGASDTALAAPRWRAAFGKAGLALFLAAYLGAALAAYLFWVSFPLAGLAAFLVLSAYHFGHDDLPPPLRGKSALGSPEGWLRGTMVLGGPAIFYRPEVQAIFEALLPGAEGEGAALLASLLQIAGLLALPLSLAAAVRDRGQRSSFLRSVICLVPFPPLVGFSLYFAFVHSLHQTAERGTRMGAGSLRDYLGRCWPFVAGGVLVMAVVGSALVAAPERATATLFIGLAVLTFPHILFGGTPRSAPVRKDPYPPRTLTRLSCETP